MTAKSISKVCSVDGCETTDLKRRGSICNTHYLRFKRHGSYDDPRPQLTETYQAPFWSSASLTADVDKCWEWQQCRDRDGYGISKLYGKKIRAHRLAFYFANGVMPSLWVLHKCDNRACINPNHLYEGTNTENVRDRMERNTATQGVKNCRAVLDDDKVRMARDLYKAGLRFCELAPKFGVAKNAIRDAILGKTWRHVT